MKILVFSDVHGNLPAFELMLKNNKDVDQFICLGDVVNYGPFSNECVDLLETLPKNTIKIIGNHEEAFISSQYPGKHPIAKAFYNFCSPFFDRHAIIKNYQESYEAYDFTFVHTILDTYIYPDSEISFDKNYMIGHSHRQFKLTSESHSLFNPGSVGQNRIHIDKSQYLLFYPLDKTVELKTVDYDFDKLFNEMKSRGYPDICLEYYLNKKTSTR